MVTNATMASHVRKRPKSIGVCSSPVLTAPAISVMSHPPFASDVPRLLVRVDADPAHAPLWELTPRPVDDRLRTVLVRREEREMHGPPRELRLVPLHRLPAEHLHDRCIATDRRHRALVLVGERLGRLARDTAGDRLPHMLSRLECDRAEL